MSKLTKEQLEKYLNFINKCIEKNFNITSEERELLGKIELASSSDKNTKDLIDIVKLAEPLYKSKEEILEILDYINIILLKKAKTKYLYTNCIKIVENTKKRIKQNANYDMCIDNMVFNMWEEVN